MRWKICIPINPIRSHETDKIEEYEYEFEYAGNTNDWDDDRYPNDAFGDSFEEFFITLVNYSEKTLKRIWELIVTLLS